MERDQIKARTNARVEVHSRMLGLRLEVTVTDLAPRRRAAPRHVSPWLSSPP